MAEARSHHKQEAGGDGQLSSQMAAPHGPRPASPRRHRRRCTPRPPRQTKSRSTAPPHGSAPPTHLCLKRQMAESPWKMAVEHENAGSASMNVMHSSNDPYCALAPVHHRPWRAHVTADRAPRAARYTCVAAGRESRGGRAAADGTARGPDRALAPTTTTNQHTRRAANRGTTAGSVSCAAQAVGPCPAGRRAARDEADTAPHRHQSSVAAAHPPGSPTPSTTAEPRVRHTMGTPPPPRTVILNGVLPQQRRARLERHVLRRQRRRRVRLARPPVRLGRRAGTVPAGRLGERKRHARVGGRPPERPHVGARIVDVAAVEGAHDERHVLGEVLNPRVDARGGHNDADGGVVRVPQRPHGAVEGGKVGRVPERPVPRNRCQTRRRQRRCVGAGRAHRVAAGGAMHGVAAHGEVRHHGGGERSGGGARGEGAADRGGGGGEEHQRRQAAGRRHVAGGNGSGGNRAVCASGKSPCAGAPAAADRGRPRPPAAALGFCRRPRARRSPRAVGGTAPPPCAARAWHGVGRRAGRLTPRPAPRHRGVGWRPRGPRRAEEPPRRGGSVHGGAWARPPPAQRRRRGHPPGSPRRGPAAVPLGAGARRRAPRARRRGAGVMGAPQGRGQLATLQVGAPPATAGPAAIEAGQGGGTKGAGPTTHDRFWLHRWATKNARKQVRCATTISKAGIGTSCMQCTAHAASRRERPPTGSVARRRKAPPHRSFFLLSAAPV